jgi:hypothetical protein
MQCGGNWLKPGRLSSRWKRKIQMGKFKSVRPRSITLLADRESLRTLDTLH